MECKEASLRVRNGFKKVNSVVDFPNTCLSAGKKLKAIGEFTTGSILLKPAPLSGAGFSRIESIKLAVRLRQPDPFGPELHQK